MGYKFKIKTQKQLENMSDNQLERYYINLEKYCSNGLYFDGNRFYFGVVN